MFFVLVRYVLRAAVRDKILIAVLAALVVGTCLAIFMGASAIVEQDAFANVFAASGLRITGVLGLVLFVVFYVRRAFESKDVEFLLSRPVSRTQFLLSQAAAFSCLAIITGLIESFCLSVFTPGFYSPGLALWGVSVIIENIIMVNVALFFALIVQSASSCVLASAGFYMLARLMGEILGIIDAGVQMPGGRILSWIIQAISVVTPRLDLMAQSSWLVYGPSGTGFGFLLLQGLIFSTLILIAARIDLARRTF